MQAVLELNSMIAPKAKLELRLKNFALQVWYAATWLQHEAFLDLFDLSLVKPYAKHVIVLVANPMPCLYSRVLYFADSALSHVWLLPKLEYWQM